MADVRLTLDDEVSSAFKGAQSEASTVRFLALFISDDERVTLGATCDRGSRSVGEDFEAIAGTLDERQPKFIAFCKSGGDGAAKSWVLITYVPDLAKPKEKMLYSSSRDALKKDLGVAAFTKSDFFCTEKADLLWESYLAATGQDGVHSDAALSLAEQQMQQENAAMEAERAATPGGKSVAMGDLPFAVAPAASAALAAFAGGGSKTSIGAEALALSLIDETVTLLTDATFTADQCKYKDVLSTALFPDGLRSATFVLLRVRCATINGSLGKANEDRRGFQSVVTFAYACPDEAHIKEKMIHSTAKSSVLSLIADSSIIVGSTVEVRTKDELDSLMVPSAHGEGSPAAASGPLHTEATLPPNSGDRIQKPKPRGRKGTTSKVKKFVADED